MSQTGPSWLTATGVHFSYSSNMDVFRDLQFEVPAASQAVAFVGTSGAGKSTLLGLVGGWLAPQRGQMRVFGDVFTGPDAARAVVFQNHNLLPWKSVRANIEFALPRSARGEHRDLVDRLLGQFGLTNVANHRPSELSGGMAQRVGIARALAAKPKLLLLDEPFGSLDFSNRENLLSILRRDVLSSGTRIAVVSHDLDMVLQLADCIYVVRGGTVEHLSIPATLPVAAHLQQDSEARSDALGQLRHLLRCPRDSTTAWMSERDGGEPSARRLGVQVAGDTVKSNVLAFEPARDGQQLGQAPTSRRQMWERCFSFLSTRFVPTSPTAAGSRRSSVFGSAALRSGPSSRRRR